MNLQEKIEALVALGQRFSNREDEDLQRAMRLAQSHNAWFIQENIGLALDGLTQHFLQEDLLLEWLTPYKIENTTSKKRLALVLAGNIPLVGFHDIISCFLTDNICMIKASSKDEPLVDYVIASLNDIDERTVPYFIKVERLADFDAIIATGSDNSARYFHSYFDKYPNVIRKNRNAVAVVTKDQSDESLLRLGQDVFQYFGLGCRNVSKLYLEEGFDYTRLMQLWEAPFGECMNHNKYKNNYDYNYALYLLNKEEFYSNQMLILKPDENIASRISCLHFEYFSNLAAVQNQLNKNLDQIQCILSEQPLAELKTYAFGESQRPKLNDYADGIDTIQFLMTL